MTTFQVETVPLNKKPFNITKHPAANLRNVRVQDYSDPEDGWFIAHAGIPSYGENGWHGLVAAVHASFAGHFGLELRPEHFFITCFQQFAILVNKFPEQFRSHLGIMHSGKKVISIEENSFVKGNPDIRNDWSTVFSRFSSAISENVGVEFFASADAINKISSCTPLARTVNHVVLMDALQKYFDYAVRTMCGIPSIILHGTPEDWMCIKTSMEKWNEISKKSGNTDHILFSAWVKEVNKILDKIIDASTKLNTPTSQSFFSNIFSYFNKIDVAFWKNIYKYEGAKGSGGPQITGWIKTFFLYGPTNKARTISEICDPYDQCFPSGRSSVPFKWEYHGTKYDMNFIAGITGIVQHGSTLNVQPNLYWAVTEPLPENAKNAKNSKMWNLDVEF